MAVHVQTHACHCIKVTLPMFCRSELQRKGDAHAVSCFSALYFRIEAMTVSPSLPPSRSPPLSPPLTTLEQTCSGSCLCTRTEIVL